MFVTFRRKSVSALCGTRIQVWTGSVCEGSVCVEPAEEEEEGGGWGGVGVARAFRAGGSCVNTSFSLGVLPCNHGFPSVPAR